MDYLVFVYNWNSRELRKIINMMLKIWVADNIKKVNYVQNYGLDDKKLEKNEEKILLISTENQAKLMAFLDEKFLWQIKKINLC